MTVVTAMMLCLLAPPLIVTWDGGGDGTSWSDPLQLGHRDRTDEHQRAIIDLVGSNPTVNVDGRCCRSMRW